VPVELLAQIHTARDAAEIPDGWRGLIDFGEVWTAADEALWPSGSGTLPGGQPLAYGCELRRDARAREATVRFLFLDQPREVMKPGMSFTLREGLKTRASGMLL
jgi:hypothetical protein